MLGRRQLEAEDRSQRRREREDAAPRLKDRVAALLTLSIDVDDHLGATRMAKTRYVRHVVVDRAPALFDIPCSEAGCEDGGHDVTNVIMSALSDGDLEFAGEDICFGYRGSDRCERVLYFAGHATYSEQQPQGASNWKR